MAILNREKDHYLDHLIHNKWDDWYGITFDVPRDVRRERESQWVMILLYARFFGGHYIYDITNEALSVRHASRKLVFSRYQSITPNSMKSHG